MVNLSRLCNALAEIALAEPAGCVVDLCGHTFAGGISDCDLSLPPKFTLCNGTLGMGTGKLATMTCNVTMKDLRIIGGNQSCVVDVRSSSSVTMLDCKVEGSGDGAVQVSCQACLIAEHCSLYSSQGSGLLVQKGGQAILRECESRGNMHHGALVGDQWSYLLAHSCVFEFNALDNVKVCCASMLLVGCHLNASKAFGLHAADAANGTAIACSISGNHQGNVSVKGAASIFLDGCECSGSYGDGWQVEGELSCLVARQCVTKNNFLDNAAEIAGGKCICLDSCDMGGEEICRG
ncbi:hypothetical protein DUNSADRAFT_18255 [Dunaliella salina]|uniref:Right handed beta helix domain-containing protein n=1 Tax=Dunaliella salina TaxID=3046 RepID=A0ABQ7G0E9_DUNSA|nr:hypothetical protein DUNSADRAFT_18255 [Dunaliella salina]|eukprot:KAF5828083.1 hypothetical protein DUNSADRAFT_18255 [Dunaliella salina]